MPTFVENSLMRWPTSLLREASVLYGHFAGENDALSFENTVLWDESAAIPQT